MPSDRTADLEFALAPRGRRRVWIEIVVAYVLILVVIWTPRPAQRWTWWIAAASVVFFTCISFDGTQAMGLRAKNFLRSLWVAGAAVLIAAAAVFVAARLHTLHAPAGPMQFIANYFAYAIWACAQQFLLECYFLLRFLRLMPDRRWAALASAGIFAAAHLPNPVLTPITLLWGVAACFLFLRYRNLYPLALAHAILGITISLTVPGPLDHNMRVGWSYLTYSPHVHHFHAR